MFGFAGLEHDLVECLELFFGDRGRGLFIGDVDLGDIRSGDLAGVGNVEDDGG